MNIQDSQQQHLHLQQQLIHQQQVLQQQPRYPSQPKPRHPPPYAPHQQHPTAMSGHVPYSPVQTQYVQQQQTPPYNQRLRSPADVTPGYHQHQHGSATGVMPGQLHQVEDSHSSFASQSHMHRAHIGNSFHHIDLV